MKIGELKHNHSLTDLLKVLLFALLMLAPIGSVLTRSLYVICNKNAYQSYSEVETSTTSIMNDGDALNVGLQYTFAYTTGYTNTGNDTYYVQNGKSNIKELYFENETWTIDRVELYTDNNQTRLIAYDTNNHSHNKFNWQETSPNFYIILGQARNMPTGTRYYNVYQISYTYSKLDNVFEYSVTKLATDQMFTWTQNTPVFTGIDAMCTQLGITAPAIPIIIAYWLILTCVYIVIDIVIKLITYLTHLIGARKGA